MGLPVGSNAQTIDGVVYKKGLVAVGFQHGFEFEFGFRITINNKNFFLVEHKPPVQIVNFLYSLIGVNSAFNRIFVDFTSL